jgi:large-conductance mechanosensitive channel
MAQILFGLGIFVLFFGFILFQTWKYSNKQDEAPIKKNLGSMITPAVNFLVVFSEVFLLIYIASTAGIL